MPCRALETIVLKAIAREPSHRYASAGELAEDLQRQFMSTTRATDSGAASDSDRARLWR
ncbi:MAG: hypothetical protein R3C99_18880 [Pirellulaceae bacterium]